MKREMTVIAGYQRQGAGRRWLCWLWCLPGLLAAGSCQADNGKNFTLPVSASITSGTCEVRMFSGEDAPGTPDEGALELESDVDFSDANKLGDEGGVAGRGVGTAVTLKLLCHGSAVSGAIPVITANGTAIGADAAGYLFKGDGRSDIDPRVGAIISLVKGTGGDLQAWNASEYIAPGGTIELDAITAGNNAQTQKLSATLYTGISCGDKAACNVATGGPLKTGLLYAPVTFSFAYR
ncbi:hypothetical protein EH228_04165 [Erwinia endophytica]|uniref:hypothetical protein n=1 Tax=Erwinia endophytica TaxID=1563158 RepID=UPI001265FB8E|nr:hypothetical protein [Erwinia endophytica]KAB8313330.1 hypothetical protein EH228_04165 [Erwinia endophytica]